MNTYRKILALFVVISALTSATLAIADDEMKAVRSRIEARLSQIDALKADGMAGENNAGYLELRKDGGGLRALVAAENRDRELVYSAIAKRTGSSAERVGKARAVRIAERSPSGIWVQDSDNSWAKK